VLAHGNGLVCGLFMSGSTARGRRPGPCGGTLHPPSGTTSGCQTHAGGGARSFEEAEETGHLLDPLADILRVDPG